MSKEKVFIILSHKHSLKSRSKTEWEVTETVEFVNQVRQRHASMSSAIGDYINKKMISGSRHGMTDYDKFEQYIRTKYAKQMAELDKAYRTDQVVVETVPVAANPEIFADEFGNVRARTVFDTV